MTQLITHNDTSSVTPPGDPRPFASLTTAAMIIVLIGLVGLGVYGYSTRVALSNRIAALERVTADQLTAQLDTIKSDHAAVVSNVAAVADRAGATAEALDNTRGITDTLVREQARTAKSVAANMAAVKSAREESEARVAEVSSKIAGVSNDVKAVSGDLAAARADVADNARKVSAVTAATTSLSSELNKTGSAIAELRRRGEREYAEFDIRKGSSPETWTVAGVRIELKKADEKRSKYDAVLHVDDKRLEKKDRTMNEPVPFLVGRDRVRYELVVTAVDHDRIRGYVSMPLDPLLAAEKRVALE